MIIARAGAALLVVCLGAVPAAGAEQAPPTAGGRSVAGSSAQSSLPAEVLRLAATKKQVTSRTQPGRTEDRVTKLEQRVAELEAQVEQLLSILEVKGQDVTLRGREVRIEGEQSLDLKAPQTAVESQGTLRLKGGSIKLNNGSKPIARVGSAVSAGVVSNGASTVLAP